ncbi:MAG: allose kinase [Oscillospiraceae bacterium]|nr:allose kinase [Oscillospiraceae bacterium]
MTVLSADIGGTNFRLGAVEEDGRILKFEKLPTSSVFSSGNVLSDLEHTLFSFSEGISFDAVAIGFPATLNRERTQVVQAPNIPFMENVPVREHLQKALGIPVLAERDVTFALCFDAAKYRLPDSGLICGIYFGTGIGNAILLDGKPLTGRHGSAGELGHIPVPGCQIPCGCGNIGCLEAVAGGKALARIQKEQYPETPIGDMFSRHGRDQALLALLDGMAIAVATEINILDPDQVLLGGGVLSMNGFPRPLLEEKIREHTRKPLPWRELELIFTEDEADKSVIGGAIYARGKLKKQNGKDRRTLHADAL